MSVSAVRDVHVREHLNEASATCARCECLVLGVTFCELVCVNEEATGYTRGIGLSSTQGVKMRLIKDALKATGRG